VTLMNVSAILSFLNISRTIPARNEVVARVAMTSVMLYRVCAVICIPVIYSIISSTSSEKNTIPNKN